MWISKLGLFIMDKIASKSEAFFGADTVKAPEPKLGSKPILGNRYTSERIYGARVGKIIH